MMHPNRRFKVTTIETVDELALQLTQYSWTLCTGFAWNGLLFLNDATSEDGAQEYAVIRNGTQIESLTASWMTQERMKEVAEEIAADVNAARFPSYTDRVGPTDHGRESCRLCA